jgi:hypothetical protein
MYERQMCRDPGVGAVVANMLHKFNIINIGGALYTPPSQPVNVRHGTEWVSRPLEVQP